MKKQIIILSSLLLIIGGLVGALVFLRRLPPPPEAPAGLSMIGDVDVLDFEAPLAEVTVAPSGGTGAYTVIRLPGESSPADPGSIQDAPASLLVGREDLPLDVSKTDDLLARAGKLTATRLLYESAEDYGAFGLDEPMISVKITDVEGLGKTLLIGGLAPDGNNNYVRIQGEPAVYLVPSYRLSLYEQPETSYISRQITSGGAADLYTAQRMTLGGAVRADYGDVVITPVLPEEASPMDMDSFMLRSPVSRPLDPQYGQEPLAALFGLEADEVAAIYPDEGLLAACGLDQPYATASVINSDNGGFTLLTGEPDEQGQVSLMREGVPLVYIVDAEKLPWLKLRFDDMMNRYVTEIHLDEVTEIAVESDGRLYRFAIDHSDPSRIGIHIDGRDADRERFMAFCETLRKASFEELTSDPLPAGAEPILRITIRYGADTPDKTFAFYPGSSRRYFVEAGDMDFRFYTSSLYVDKALAEAMAAAGGDTGGR